MQGKTIQCYQEALKQISSNIALLSDNKNYVERLINGNDLLPMDHALRDFIEQFRD